MCLRNIYCHLIESPAHFIFCNYQPICWTYAVSKTPFVQLIHFLHDANSLKQAVEVFHVHLSSPSLWRGWENKPTHFEDCYSAYMKEMHILKSWEWSRPSRASMVKSLKYRRCFCALLATFQQYSIAYLHICASLHYLYWGLFHTPFVSGFCQFTLFTANYVSLLR